MELVLAVSQVQLARLIAVAFLFKRSPRSWFTASTGAVSAEAGIDLIKTPEQLKSPGIVRGFFISTRYPITHFNNKNCGATQTLRSSLGSSALHEATERAEPMKCYVASAGGRCHTHVR